MENEKRQHKPYIVELMKLHREVNVAYTVGDKERLQRGLVNLTDAIDRFQKVIGSDSVE